MKPKSITEGALLAVISLVLSLIFYYIPLLSGFSYFLLPLPIIIMYKRNGGIPALMTGIVSGLLLLLFMDPVNALYMASSIVFPGLFLGYAYYSNSSGSKRVVLGYVGFLLVVVVQIMMAQIVTGIPFTEEFVKEIDSVTTTLKDTYKEAGLLEGAQGEALLQNLDIMVETMEMLLPTMILLIPLAFSYLTVVLFSDRFLSILKIKYTPLKSIYAFHFSTASKNLLAVITLIVVILNMIASGSPYEVYTFTMQNLLLILYFVMGYSFISWYFVFRFHKRLTLVRLLIVLGCLLINFLLTFVVILGVFDIYFNLRKFITMRRNE